MVGTYHPGDPAHYQDGDIIQAFNDRRVGKCNAQLVCKARKGTLVDGLRQSGTLFEEWLSRTRRYRFERVSRTAIERLDLSAPDPETTRTLIDSTPRDIDGRQQHMHVVNFVALAMLEPRMQLFGSPGSEYWYSTTRVPATDAVVDSLWTEIEARSPVRRSDHLRYPLGAQDKRLFLPVAVDDFGDAERKVLMGRTVDADGLITAKRNLRVDWRNDLGLTGRQKQDIDDSAIEVDLRDEATFDRGLVVRTRG